MVAKSTGIDMEQNYVTVTLCIIFLPNINARQCRPTIYTDQRRGFTVWWRGTVVERRSLAGELSLSCARPAADG